MNAAIYCRVSTDDQEKEGTSLTTQLEACLKYCQDKGYTVIKQFSETYSGTTLDRPQLTQLRDLVVAGEVDVIVIYCLDRISRDPTHGAILTEEFEKLNVRLEAATEIIENTSTGKLISYIRGYASQMEVDKIRERTNRGKAARLKQGHLPIGTGIGAYGYMWDKTTKKRVIVDAQAAVVRRIFDSVNHGNSLSQIAKDLNDAGIATKTGLVWCHTTVRRTVTNPIYAGETYYGRRKRSGKTTVQAQDKDRWILLPDVTPPIVDKTVFDAAQESIKRKYRPARTTDSTYFLTGFMFCPECGSPVCGATLSRKYRYYCCRGTRPTRTRGVICNAPYIKADEVEFYVWDRLVKLTQSPATIMFSLLNYRYDSTKHPGQLIPIIDKQIKALQTKLNTYSPREQNLIHLYAEEAITKEHLLTEVNNMRERETEDKRQIAQLLKTRNQAAAASKFTLKLSEHSEKLRAALPHTLTPESKKEFLGIYGVRVEAARGKYSFCCYADFKLTSEILHSDMYNEDFETGFAEGLRELEKQHPEITMAEILDFSKELPGDHLFAKVINDLKKPRPASPSTNRSYITIEQTSA